MAENPVLKKLKEQQTVPETAPSALNPSSANNPVLRALRGETAQERKENQQKIVANIRETQNEKAADEPTAWERVKNTASGWGNRQASSYAGAAENFLEIARDLDTKNSASFKKANQAKENAAHYREMLNRGTWDNGATITADDRKQIEKLIASNEKNAKVYAEGAAKIHEPISGVIANVDTYGDRKAKESEAALTEAKRGASTVGKIAVDLGVVAGDIASDALANVVLPGSAVLTRGTRMYGEGAESAEDKGFGLGEQFAYGAGKAALGELTNRAFSNNPILEKAFGKGALDDIVFPGLNATKGGRIVKSGLGEALEETGENIGDIGLQALLFGDKHDKITAKDVGYDALLASIIGSGTTAISPSPRNSVKESSATQIAKSEGTNATEANVTQNGLNEQISGVANYDPVEAAAIKREAKTFRNLVAGVDGKVSAFFEKWRNGRVSQNGEKLEKLYLGRMPEAIKKRVSDILGYEVNERDFVVTNDTVKHIYDHHGNAKAETDRGNIPLEPWMFDALPDVVTNPDSVEPGNIGRGNKNAGKQAVLFSKAYPGGTIITVQFDNKGRGTMEINTLYANKNKGTPSKLDAETSTPNSTPEALEPVPSESSVAQVASAVKADDGLGAANFGFDPYSNLQNRTSDFHPEGANAARPVDVPTTDFDGRNVPKSASTVMGAQATPDQSVVQLEKMIANGELSFDTITDKDSVNKAKATIDEKTFGGALEQYRQAVNTGVASKDNTTLGQQLLIMAMRSGNVDATAELLSLYTRNSTTAAQALQAQSIFRKLSPEGQLVAVQKAIDAMNQKYGTEHTIDPADVKAFLEAKDTDARKEAEKEIVKKAAQALPKTFKAKFDTLRYLAMLGNARTHIRNILGNSLFQIPVAVKNRVGAGLELIANKASGGKIERTKSLAGVNPFGDLAKDARADWANVKDFLEQNRSYSENRSLLKDIEGEAHAFKDSNPIGATINALSDANSNLLAAEDTAAKRLIYTQSLAGYLKANGCKRIADASPELLNRARTYAANEALRNTFNDTNALSEAVGRMSGLTNSDNAAIKAAGYVVEGVLPFKKTPANILVRAEEYSPIGAGIGIINTIRGTVKGDTATISKGLEQLAAGATGTALLTLGALAAGNGWVTGKEDEDEAQAGFDELTGHQNYALELKDGTSITLDWLAPEAIPFFVGVELYNAGLNGRITPSEFFDALKNSTAPMLEMSLLQSLNDTVENASYAKFSGGSVLGSLVSSALTNYLTQVVPTIGGQMERASEEERMTTYTDKNSDLSTDMQYTIGKVSQRIPGWDYQQIPYIDAWGRTESTGDPLERAANNLFNPAYMSEVDVDNVETELQRLYDAVGTEYGNPFPQRADKSFDVDGKTKNLTADEYVKYAKAKGENSYKFVQQAMQSPAYKSMSDKEKAEFIVDMYGYANYKAKKTVAPKYSNDMYAKYEAAEKAGMAPVAYYTMKQTYDYDKSSASGQPTQEEAQRYLDTETNLSKKQKADMWTIINKSWKNNPYK